MPDFDRYLAALEDSHAQRLLEDEDDCASRAFEMFGGESLACDLDPADEFMWPTGSVDDDDPEMAEDADDRESRLDRLATDAEYRSDCDRDREMEDRA